MPLTNYADNSQLQRSLRANIFKEVVKDRTAAAKPKNDYSGVNKDEVGQWAVDHCITEMQGISEKVQ